MGSKPKTMDIKVMYHRRFSKKKHLDFRTKISSLSSDGILIKIIDGIFGKRVPKECPTIYVCERIKFKQGSDLDDCKVVPAGFCSHKRPRGVLNITLVLPVGLSGGRRKMEIIEAKETYQRRLGEEKSVDFLNKMSSLSPDGISPKMIPEECRNPRIHPRRKCTQRSRSSDQKVVQQAPVLVDDQKEFTTPSQFYIGH